MDWIGRTIAGRYRVVERIGKGGMGVVWRARDERLERDVALKVLLKQDDAAGVERFKIEARAAAALSDPRIVTVHDFGDDDGSPFIVMELLAGTTLRAELEARGRRPWREALSIVASIAGALDVAHRAGLVHRDLKPENVFLVGGSIERIKILDFGLARLLDAPAASSGDRITQTGAFVGTPGYTAPETAMLGVVDARADLYALGVIAFELLTGHAPYTAQTAAALVLKHATEPAPPPSSSTPDIPALVDALVAHLLAKKPEQRTPSAAALVFEIESAGADTDPGSSDKHTGLARDAALALDDAARARDAARAHVATLVGNAPVAPAHTSPRSHDVSAPEGLGSASATGSTSSVPTETALIPPHVRRARPGHVGIAAIAVVVVVAAVVVVALVGRKRSTNEAAVRDAIVNAKKVASLAVRAKAWTTSPDGSSIIVATDEGYLLVDTATQSQRRPPAPPSCNLDELYYRADGRLIVNCIDGKASVVWDLDPKTGAAHVITRDLAGMAPSPVDDRIAASSSTLGVFVADANGNKLAQLVDPQASWLWAAQWPTRDAVVIRNAGRFDVVNPDDRRHLVFPQAAGAPAGLGGLLVFAREDPRNPSTTVIGTTTFADLLEGKPAVDVARYEANGISLAGGARALAIGVMHAKTSIAAASIDATSIGTFHRVNVEDSDVTAPVFLDAHTLAFSVLHAGSWSMFAQHLDTGEASALGGDGAANIPAGAVDGSVVYWAFSDDSHDARLLLRVDGAKDRELTRVPVGAGERKSVPPGVSVSCALTSCLVARLAGAGGSLDVVDARTGAVVDHVEPAARGHGRAWLSPDASVIALLDGTDPSDRGQVRLYNRASKTWSVRVVVDGNAPSYGPAATIRALSFTSSADALIAEVHGEGADGRPTNSFLRVPLPDGPTTTLAVHLGLAEARGDDTTIIVAPDGATLATVRTSWSTDLFLAQLR